MNLIAGLSVAGAVFAAEPNYNAGPVDASKSVIARNPRVSVSYPDLSPPLRLMPPVSPAPSVEHDVRPIPHLWLPTAPPVDPVAQRDLPTRTMPVTQRDFIAQGKTNTASSVTGTPPDTNGAVGLHHFIQTVNGGYEIWDKSGNIVLASQVNQNLWTGYVGTHTGNSCASRNDGDPVVVYDQLADRWVITQFSVPNNSGPDWQCVAVSQTSDPTGQWYRYDFDYTGFNDYGKFGIWPDGYYATFNMFGNGDSDLCAYDRVKMLQGLPATQQCFQQTGYSGALPVSLDGPVPPPRGEPGYFLAMDPGNAGLDLWKLHVDWATPSNTTMSGPLVIPVAAYTPACGGGTCIPQGAGSQVDSLADRLMFRLSYRNFGTHSSLVVNHSVATSGSNGSGLRWYEIRSPSSSAPVVFQQGTYAPADANFRWMGSIAQDQARNFALGFSISSTTQDPAIGWTGRLNSDATGTMGQGETVIDTGAGTEIGASRWGDYSNMTVDPADDCTFWYTQELYNTGAAQYRDWDTYIASVKFANCAANDFSISLSPPAAGVGPGGQAAVTVNTAIVAGTAETIALTVQDLPTGVTGVFAPPSVTAGTPSTLTLSAPVGAPTTPMTSYTVIGTATSAVHPATGQVSVANVPTVALTAPVNGATVMGLVTVNANATAANGTTLTGLAVTIDGTSVVSATSSPVTYAWNTIPVSNGSHTVVATATDADGNSASASATVTVLNGPQLSLTPDGGAVSGTVQVRAAAAVPAGTALGSLSVSVDGTQTASGTATPVTYAWDTTGTSNGAHALSATALDTDTSTATVNANVTVANPPVVAITNPSPGSVSGSVSISATATAPAGTALATLAISVDGVQLSSGAASPATASWDSTTVVDGTHVLTATATDQDGTTATSPGVTVTTSNGTVGTPDGGNSGDGGSHPNPNTGKSGCGCTSAGSAPWVSLCLAALGGVALRRNRRNRTRQ